MAEVDSLRSEAILDMTDILTRYGFNLDEAIKESRQFWGKHKKKLNEILRW